MFTCCPECKTCFRITGEQLAMAKGLVRCGHCQKVFNGSENLTAGLPDNNPDEYSLDSRHEADKHDSDVFAADFSITNGEGLGNKLIGDKGEGGVPLSSEHFELPSFSARDDFIEASHQDEDSIATKDPTISQPGVPTTELDDAFDNLADDWFLQGKGGDTKQEQTGSPVPIQEQAESTYEYTDITDTLEEEKNIDDIFSDMHQQLELGMARLEKNEPGAGILDDDPAVNKPRNTKKKKDALNDEDEINQAIDSIFADSALSLYGEKPEDQDYQVEKEMLAAFGKDAHTGNDNNDIKFEDETVSLANLAHPLEEELPVSSGKTPGHDIPHRLRDSLSITEPEKTSAWKVMASLILIMLLSVALLTQLALFRNIEIVSQFPQTRPWLEQFCRYAPCRIHARRDIDQIKILERDIRVHPQNKKALLITASIVNKATFAQPYPDIRVTLSDLTGTVVAQRHFIPADYLGSLNSSFLLMKPGTPVHIRIGILDPGRDAVNFEFQFL